GGYAEGVGDWFGYGNPQLAPTGVTNADVRIEAYPGSNQLVAISGYYKRFDRPIVTAVEYAGQTICRPRNGVRATNYGVELELRKALGPFFAATNFTLLRSRITLPDSIGIYPAALKFHGQSPYLINACRTFAPAKATITAAVRFNRFGERIVRYGLNTGTFQARNFVEVPRSTLDAKLKLGLWGGLSLALAGKNLLDSPYIWRDDKINEGATAPVQRLRSKGGRVFSVGLSYAP